ncbi:MAG TPA: type II secretion system minor pseudopilin GspK, partial [Cellvibrionaceae bacterium]|nr:type II secretion system minor pseudopilin GspK [Cellvibrionaceae bacterium]
PMSRGGLGLSLQRQRGVVLILAMFIVVLVTSIAISTSWRFELDMTRNENRWHGARIRNYGLSAENFVLKYAFDGDESGYDCLTPDMKDNRKLDFWAAEGMTWDMNEASIDLKIIDLNRKFNLNMLVHKVQPKANQTFRTPADQYTEAQKMFIRLLQTIEIDGQPMDTASAIEITDAVVDWLDADSEPTGSGGAEQNYYDSLEEPYPIGNRPMISVSELALVKGVTPYLYSRLLPLVTAISPDSKLNINTMPQGLERIFNAKDVLEPFDARRLESIKGNPRQQTNKNKQKNNGGEKADDNPALCSKSLDEAIEDSLILSDLAILPNALDKKALQEFVDVKSEYFALYSTVKVGEITRVNKSLLHRSQSMGAGAQGSDPITVIRRTDGDF